MSLIAAKGLHTYNDINNFIMNCDSKHHSEIYQALECHFSHDEEPETWLDVSSDYIKHLFQLYEQDMEQYDDDTSPLGDDSY